MYQACHQPLVPPLSQFLLQALDYDLSYDTVFKPMDLDFSPLGTCCTPIIGTENRGISGAQLKRLRNFLTNHSNTGGWLNGWIDLTPAEYSPTSGLRLNVNTINLYQVLTHHLLQPG